MDTGTNESQRPHPVNAQPPGTQHICGTHPIDDQGLKDCVNYAWYLVAKDEISMAEQVLLKLPGFYRDHPPEIVMKMREKIRQFKMTIHDYAMAPDDVNLVSPEHALKVCQGVLRGAIILKNVKDLNEAGQVPHIVEMGPGEFWLPLGLKGLGCQFTYQTFFLHKNAYDKAKPHLEEMLSDVPKGPVIYVACEILEHLHDIHEIPQTLLKTGHDAQFIHLSTPLYTFSGACPNWDEPSKRGLGGHLRTYTPDEFKAVARELFPAYNWVDYTQHEVMSLVGVKNGKT